MLFLLIILSVLGLIYALMAEIQKSVNKKSETDRLIKKVIQFPYAKKVMITSLLILVIGISVNTTLYKIGAQEVGVIVTPKGVSEEILYTGWHLVAPWNSVKLMDKTVWVYTLTRTSKEGNKHGDDAIWAPTSDGIKMGFDISVNWHINPARANWIYSNISGDQDSDGRYHWIEENIIRPAVKSIMPNTISNYTPIDCYSGKRQEIQEIVQKALKAELMKTNIIIDMAQIRDVYYNPTYEESINQKKLEEQKVLTLVQITRQKEEQLKQANIDKDMKIAQAEGEARALQIKGNSITSNPRIIQLQWIEKWDGQLPTYMTGSNTSMMMMLDNKDK